MGVRGSSRIRSALEIFPSASASTSCVQCSLGVTIDLFAVYQGTCKDNIYFKPSSLARSTKGNLDDCTSLICSNFVFERYLSTCYPTSHMWTLSSFARLAGRANAQCKGSVIAQYYKMSKPKQWKGSYQSKRQKVKAKATKEGSNEEVLHADVLRLLATRGSKEEENDGHGGEKDSSRSDALPERFSEIKVVISELSSTGDGIGFPTSSKHVFVVPFTVPGDVVQAKVVNHFVDENYTLTDFIKVIEPSVQRDDTRSRCPYFTKCSGCQFQMLSYQDQLTHKKSIVERAYRNFSTLAPELIPPIGETIGSPLQYGYRTKLTPHFDKPRRSQTGKSELDGIEEKGRTKIPPIGFMLKSRKTTMDIEDCPIGTDAVRIGMRKERERVAREIKSYKRGATLLLRESTSRILKHPSLTEPSPSPNVDNTTAEAIPEISDNALTSARLQESKGNTTETDMLSFAESKTCITDSNATSTEYIGDYVFKNTAGAFFQNNNSILPRFTAYIRERILPPATSPESKPAKYLIDAYCGSGLFTVTLSSLFSSSMGIDISPASITSAHQNAKANHIDNATFMTADASALFKEVNYPPEETVVVIDPPRKGCDNEFLSQLLRFGPHRVVYVSCNVHTQARDVGILVVGKGGTRYNIESLRGFDFFPQTGHVEGVAILNRHMEGSHGHGEEDTAVATALAT